MAVPLVRWAGGKTQLLHHLNAHLPEHFGRYHECFVGGGALFFHLECAGRLRHGAVLGDLNAGLIELYRVVRDDVAALIEALIVHAPYATDRDYFYAIRSWDRRADWLQRSSIERAARFLYLNRVGYNGLYRVNRDGHFNVAFGAHKNPLVCDVSRLQAASEALQGVELLVSDFGSVVDRAVPGDCVYLDPPYVPVSKTSDFTTYTAGGFDHTQQQRLADVVAVLVERGCFVLLSNAATLPVHELYGGYPMTEVSARRPINCVGDRRGAVREVIVAAGAGASLA